MRQGKESNERPARLSNSINRTQALALYREFHELARLVSATKIRLGKGYIRQAVENLDQAEGLVKKTERLFAEMLRTEDGRASAMAQDLFEPDDNDEWVRHDPEADQVNW